MTADEINAHLSRVSPDSEDAVEWSCLQKFQQLGWEPIHAYEEIDGDPTLLGRQHHGEVVLTRYLLPAIKRLNPEIPDLALDEAVSRLTRDRSAMDIVTANKDVYHLLKEGVPVNFRDAQGELCKERVYFIDWRVPENNDFLIVSQLWINGDPYTKRADLVGFVNGIPLLFIELKAPHENVYHAFKDNFRDYKSTIPHLFWYNGVVALSNGGHAKMGSVTAPWEHFNEWKKINDEGEVGVISLDTLLLGTCEKSRFLDIIENFALFKESTGGYEKLVGKYHQVLGVNNALRAVHHIRQNKGRLGVFWHTQGSGKSASMVFFSQKVLRTVPGNWTFVVITDRAELDDQIYGTFQRCGVVKEGHVQATSSVHLRQLLTEDHRFVFTLIHKFRTENGERHPMLSERDDIIIMTDEAHRSQYDMLAQNMRDALPNAAFLGFTGTPLISGEEERTREVFGEYVSIYNFRQSIEDGATVPLYYENRLPEVQLKNENLNDDLNQLIDEALLDPEQEKKLEREFRQMYRIITLDERLESIAENMVEHFIGRAHRGKAMFIAIDKATAVKMYDKVQKHWKLKLAELNTKYLNAKGGEFEALKDTIEFMETTDMAVVVSSGQNEVEDLKVKGVDILPHRRRMVKEDLETKFKDSDNPFRIVFVCAMWITGFDVPSCSTIYLDKPMKNHTLMQTIARANRVFGDKTSGLIVDYVGVFRNLEKALAVYAAPESDAGGDTPIKDKAELKEQLKAEIADMNAFLSPFHVDLEIIRKEQDVFQRTAWKNDAVDAILTTDETKKEFMRRAEWIKKIYKAYLPDPIEPELGETAYLIRKMAHQIREMAPVPDIDDVLADIDALLDESVQGFRIQEPKGGYKRYDLSEIDFDALRKKFEQGRKRTILEQVRKAIETRLGDMVQINHTRMDWLEQYRELIKKYQDGSINLDELFERLKEFAQNLNEEQKRYVREGLDNEQQLTVFDMLTKPEMKLTKAERQEVKLIARELFQVLQDRMVLDWKKRQQTRARVKLAIQRLLDRLPSVYDKETYEKKCDAVYKFVYNLEKMPIAA